MSLGEYLDNESLVLSLAPSRYSNYDLAMSFILEPSKGNVLARIGLTFIRPDEWLSNEQNSVSLPRIFQEIDALPEIYVDSNHPTDGNLLVIYREQGIYALYDFKFESSTGTTDSPLKLCLSVNNTQRIGLALAKDDTSFNNLPSSNFYVPFEEAFNISLETFVQFFREHPDDCLTLSQSTAEPVEATDDHLH